MAIVHLLRLIVHVPEIYFISSQLNATGGLQNRSDSDATAAFIVSNAQFPQLYATIIRRLNISQLSRTQFENAK